jgi:voltage-gated potassium channel Kch
MQKVPFNERFRYWVDNIISKGTPALIIGLAIVFFGVAFVTGVLVYLTEIANVADDGSKAPYTFYESFWRSLMHVIDQGTVTGEEGWAWRIIMFPVSLIGILLVSLLVSFLNAGFQVKLDELKKGKSNILEENQTVILGWSSKIFPIVSELVLANLNQSKSCIVILADMDKTEMEDEIKVKVGKTGKTKVICRSGNPIDVDDLKIANLNAAKSIIIVAPEEAKADTYVIKTIMAIVNNPSRKDAPYNIIAEINEDINKDIAKLVGKEEVTILVGNEVISKITVQSSRQSGLSIVYSNLLGYADNEIYIQPVKNIAGHTFEELLYGFEDVCVIGIRYADGKVEINPPLQTKLTKDDKMIIIAEDDIDLSYHHKKISITELPEIILKKEKTFEVHKTLILGWNSNARIVVKELDNYVRPGSEILVMAEGTGLTDKILNLSVELKNQKIKFNNADINDRNQLNKLDLKHYNHIIIMSYSDTYPLQEADAITLITLMNIRDILSKINHKVSLVTEMLDLKNRALADLSKADDFIISDRMISLILAQLSENKELSIVFDDLFDADGNEIYIKPYTDYMPPNTTTDFFSVIQATTKRKEIAFGYIMGKHADNPDKNYGVVINPNKSDKVTFSDGDRIIMIAEE